MSRSSNKEFDPNASELNHKAYKIGCENYNQGHFKKAAKAFNESLEYWPEDPQAWFALGDCYDELNKPTKAEKCFRKSLQFTTPDKQSDVLYNLGNSLLDQAKFEEAIECYVRFPLKVQLIGQRKSIWNERKMAIQIKTHNKQMQANPAKAGPLI